MAENKFFDFKDVKIIEPLHTILVDTDDKYRNTLMLTRIIDGDIEILLVKNISCDKEFGVMVKNISSYFNAEIIKRNV